MCDWLKLAVTTYKVHFSFMQAYKADKVFS